MVTFDSEQRNKLDVFHNKKLQRSIWCLDENLLKDLQLLILQIYILGLRDRTVTYEDIPKVDGV